MNIYSFGLDKKEFLKSTPNTEAIKRKFKSIGTKNEHNQRSKATILGGIVCNKYMQSEYF